MLEIEGRIREAQQGKTEERDRLVEENMGLVYMIVKRFGNRGIENDDLVQVGIVGLLKAIDRFDFSYNVCFSTYAIPMIMGEIRRMLRDFGSIRVSRSLKERAYKTMRTKEELTMSLGREPTISEISEKMNMSEEEIVECLDSVISPVSLAEPVAGEGKDQFCVGDCLKDKKQGEDVWIEKIVVHDAMNILSEREKKIIIMKYYMGKTQGEIACQINLSQAQVSRIEKRALLTMRSYLCD